MILPDLKWGYVGDRVRMRGLINEDSLFGNIDDWDISQNIPHIGIIN